MILGIGLAAANGLALIDGGSRRDKLIAAALLNTIVLGIWAIT